MPAQQLRLCALSYSPSLYEPGAVNGEAFLRGVHIVRMRWGSIIQIDANEDSQAVTELLRELAAHGVDEAPPPAIVG
ncbi:hypothetical protein [Blastococcus tunisiensis]|uniref:Uncharacterized protein n=1 Tax=Blastococcus tunisiensis TaxID=1798228 RepID=A0A1I2EIK7_9ACTN|nr:hypothetical protein [Blastococcus sp. DSM 46838]SFE92802.1 hypothetical protein SAMN05216574_10778 [Blastococcus sp. DSM 46838]